MFNGTVAIVIVSLLLISAAVAVLLVRLSGPGHTTLSGAPAAATSPSPHPATPPTTQPATQPDSGPASTPAAQVGAQNLVHLLAQSAADRSGVVNAVDDVNACGSGLAQDVQMFQQAADSRQQLLNELGTLSDGDALPAQMLQDLSDAWQSSYQADQDYAAWAQDENGSNGCTQDDSADPNLQAAAEPDHQATVDKTAFVDEWNRIAAQYGLPSYKWTDL